MPASSTTSTARRGSVVYGRRRASSSSAATLVLGIPAPSSSSRAARRASAAPTTDMPTRLPRLARGSERERLPGAGLADHDRDTGTVLGEPPHHLGLLAGDRRPLRDRPLDRRRPHDADAAHPGSRPPAPAAAARARAARASSTPAHREPAAPRSRPAAAEHPTRSPRASTTTRSDARNRSATFSRSAAVTLDAGGQLGTQRLDHVAASERRAAMREAVRRSEPRGQALDVIHVQPPRLGAADQRPDQLGRQAETAPPARATRARAAPA